MTKRRSKPRLELVETTLPHWLLPPRSSTSPVSRADLEYLFHHMIKGHSVKAILRDHPGMPDYGVIMKYIFSDPALEEEYYEAKRVQTEAYNEEMVDSARGDGDTPEDLERSKLKVATLKWLMQNNNRKRYGEVKTLNINGQLDVASAMDKAEARVEGALPDPMVIEHED
jgi:hypothetical protein